MDEPDIITTPTGFAEEILGMDLYGWQAHVIEWFDPVDPKEVVRGSLSTPNGSGKSAKIIPAIGLWWLALHDRGRVITTTRDGKQMDNQLQPAIQSYRSRFTRDWKFQDRLVESPTKGRWVMFTTDDAGRAEGWHKLDDLDGPLLIIVDEAKSVPEDIFRAIDRCTYNALLYASSPGHMIGSFYDSQFKPELGFKIKRVGLKDCPHIPGDRINSIIAKYGPDSPFTRSTLHGEFMEADGEARFDRAGLDRLTQMAKAHDDLPFNHKDKPRIGTLEEQRTIYSTLTWGEDPNGWAWIAEQPIPGCEYIAFCDPMTGEQSEGSKERDTHAAGILRLAFTDETRTEHETEVVALCHHEGGCRWDNDILAERFDRMICYYGDCMTIVEANNAGVEVIRLLLIAGRTLWRREKRDHTRPGKKLDVVGFQTNTATKNLWIGAIGKYIREQLLICKYKPACDQFATFILNEKGTGEAQDGCKDDFVTGIGLGLHAKTSATRYLIHRPIITLGQYPGVTMVEGGGFGGQNPFGGGAS